MPMSDTLTLYIGEKNISSWSMRPYVALAEKGLSFEAKTISLREDMSFNLSFLPAWSRPAAPPESLADAAEMMGMWEAALACKKDPRPFLFGPFGAVDAMFAPAVVRVASFEAPTAQTPRTAGY